jgi:protein arginine kinase activator
MRKCDQCDKPAVVHETTNKNGVQSEVHLCEDHAEQAGVHLGPPINQLVTQLMVCKEPATARGALKMCRTCGMTFGVFRQNGVLGCPDCYDSFSQDLSPMIERAQNGGTSHSGKCPRRGGASIDEKLQRQSLRRQLDDAVAAEQYERAAELRDRLRDVQPGPRGAGQEDPAPDIV